MKRFRDRVVFITGAARGQGRAHAVAFAREGADLVLCDTTRPYPSVPYPLGTPDELQQVAREVEALGRRVIAESIDVTDLAGMQQLVQHAQEQLGRLRSLSPMRNCIRSAGPGN